MILFWLNFVTKCCSLFLRVTFAQKGEELKGDQENEIICVETKIVIRQKQCDTVVMAPSQST